MNLSASVSMTVVRIREQFNNRENMQNFFLQDLELSINETTGGVGGPEYPMLTMAVRMLKLFYTPLLVTIGIIGNTLTYMTLSQAPTSKSSATPYLSMLALSDGSFLAVLILVWLTSLHVDIYNTGGWCQALTYVSYICAFLSVWLYVCLSIDRLIIICLPVRISRLCSVLRAKIVVISLTIIAIVVYLNISLLFGVVITEQQVLCLPLPPFIPIIQVLSKIDAIINTLLPYGTVVIINLYTTKCVIEHYRRRTNIIRADDLRPQDLCEERRPRTEVQNTKGILAICCVFLMLSLPSHVLRLYAMFRFFKESKLGISTPEYLWQQLLMYLFFTRFSINFFVHLGFSAVFRQSFRNLFGRLCRRKSWTILPRKKSNGRVLNGLQVQGTAMTAI